jgi:hypothetical protein
MRMELALARVTVCVRREILRQGFSAHNVLFCPVMKQRTLGPGILDEAGHHGFSRERMPPPRRHLRL